MSAIFKRQSSAPGSESAGSGRWRRAFCKHGCMQTPRSISSPRSTAAPSCSTTRATFSRSATGRAPVRRRGERGDRRRSFPLSPGDRADQVADLHRRQAPGDKEAAYAHRPRGGSGSSRRRADCRRGRRFSARRSLRLFCKAKSPPPISSASTRSVCAARRLARQSAWSPNSSAATLRVASADS